jgi:hypothetical protein
MRPIRRRSGVPSSSTDRPSAARSVVSCAGSAQAMKSDKFPSNSFEQSSSYKLDLSHFVIHDHSELLNRL